MFSANPFPPLILCWISHRNGSAGFITRRNKPTRNAGPVPS